MYLSSIRSVDLHGMDRITARITVDEFIIDLIRLKETKGVIIHGIGSGILRKEIADYLRHDKRVKDYKLDFMNPGCTVLLTTSTLQLLSLALKIGTAFIPAAL